MNDYDDDYEEKEDTQEEVIPKRKINKNRDEYEGDYDDGKDFNFDMKMGDELDKGIKLPDIMFGGIQDSSFGFDDKHVIDKGVKNLRKAAKKNIRKPKDVSFEPNFENIFGDKWG